MAMTNDEFEALVAELEERSRRDPSGYKLRVVLLAASSLRAALIALLLPAAAVPAAGEPALAQRRDQLACGSTLVTAQASCYEGTPLCVRETLTFQRPEGRTITAPHKHLASHSLRAGRSVEALDYRISAWSCVPGANGGHYVAVILKRVPGGNCDVCEYTALYHPRGQPIAATATLDAAGRPRETPQAGELIRKLTGGPPNSFKAVYGTTP